MSGADPGVLETGTHWLSEIGEGGTLPGERCGDRSFPLQRYATERKRGALARPLRHWKVEVTYCRPNHEPNDPLSNCLHVKQKAGRVFDTPWKRKVRIAQVAPLAESVPPKLYGGTERVVS
jgi:hypothetical protein